MLRLRYLLPLAAFAMVLISAVPSRGETIIDEWQNVKAPPPPELQSVTLDPKTTALLMIDIIKQTCNMQRRPRCVAMIPKVQKLLAEAREGYRPPKDAKGQRHHKHRSGWCYVAQWRPLHVSRCGAAWF